MPKVEFSTFGVVAWAWEELKIDPLPHQGGGEIPVGSPRAICITSLLLRKESR
jgi:hypothetical protein